MPDWRILKTLYTRELVHLLRDRHTLIYSIAIPVFLYPTLLLLVLQSLTVVRGWKERQVARVHVAGSPADALLRRLVDQAEGLELVDPPRDGASDGRSARERARRAIQEDHVDAVLLVENRGDLVEATLLYSSVRDASAVSLERIEGVVREYRDHVLRSRARRTPAGESILGVLEVEIVDIASGQRKANYLLSLTMPLLMVIVVLMGAFYPALDTTVGERERNTLETTLVTAVPRLAIVLGKYLAVVTLALMAFALNLASMTFSFKHIISQMEFSGFSLSPVSLLVIIGGAVLLSTLVAALMMAIAFMARSFKEGQSYMAPVYLLGVAPVAVTMSPDVPLTPFLSMVPVVNISMTFREALQGRFDWPLILSTLVFSAFWSAAAIAVAVASISREGFLLADRSNGPGRRKGSRR